MCCGARSTPSRNTYAQATVNQRHATSLVAQHPASVTFEYTGATGLTVVSPTTGKRYRFDTPGAQLAVDPQDNSMMLYVPNLRPVRFNRGT